MMQCISAETVAIVTSHCLHLDSHRQEFFDFGCKNFVLFPIVISFAMIFSLWKKGKKHVILMLSDENEYLDQREDL